VNDKDLVGEYYLTGVMEVGSGIRLNDDQTFDLFFSYGALDKSGKGTWSGKGNEITLESDPRPASDFKLVNSKHIGSRGTTIKVTDANTQILKYVVYILSGKGYSDTVEADENGTIHFNRSEWDSIGLVHEMFSDRVSYFNVSKNENNYFEFTIEPCIMNIYCNHLVLTVHDGYLEGEHPLLEPGKTYRYEKSQ